MECAAVPNAAWGWATTMSGKQLQMRPGAVHIASHGISSLSVGAAAQHQARTGCAAARRTDTDEMGHADFRGSCLLES